MALSKYLIYLRQAYFGGRVKENLWVTSKNVWGKWEEENKSGER